MQSTGPHIIAQDLFSSANLAFFQQYGSAALLTGRNTSLGSLLISDRVIHYLNILYRMLLFKRDYELEPLYDDIFHAVQSAQKVLDEEYDQNQFRTDIGQLATWNLIDFRIEKQRLRGYRDNRKRKFRYRLHNESVAFLEWLEQRCLDDMQSRGNDTRDLLGETRGSLGELLRLLHFFSLGGEDQEDTARRVLFQLFKTGDLCQEITVSLADLNGRLLFFLVQNYQIDPVRMLIREIESYVDHFLQQTYKLRVEIVPLLVRLQKEQNMDKIMACHQIMEAERQRSPNLLQARRNVHVGTIPENLYNFFAEQGGLDRMLTRINNSSMRVWQKLRSHLRELERKNNRLQDIRYRIEDLATLQDEDSPRIFMNTLLSQPLNSFDPNFWDNREKAEPPVPRRRLAHQTVFPRQYLKKKKSTGKAVESLDEARLKQLQAWIEEKIPFDPATRTGVLSNAKFDAFDDFARVIELARAGMLGEGKRLNRLHYLLTPEERRILLAVAEQELRCPELLLTTHTSASER